jgi:hypothetical protein
MVTVKKPFEPHFTFQGFRYVKVDGFPGELKPENLTAVVLHSGMKPTGHLRLRTRSSTSCNVTLCGVRKETL